MITVDDAVPLPEKARSYVRKGKVHKVPKTIITAMEAYREAYKLVFHIRPEIYYDGQYIRVKGASSGVKLRRLKEMTTQLLYRAG